MIIAELTPEYCTQLLAEGFTDEVRAFTRRLRGKPELVMAFERVFDDLVYDAAIDWTRTPSQEELFLRAEQCLEEMDSFLAKMSSPYTSFVVVLNHGSEVTVEIGWEDGSAGRVLWDRWTTEVDDPVMAFVNIGFLYDVREYRWEAKQTAEVEPPLYRYHPERFKSYRDYADDIGSLYRGQVNPSSGALTLDQLNDVARLVTVELNGKSLMFPRKWKEDYPQPSLVIEAESSLATAYGRFVQAGRQIMDLATASDMVLSDDRAELRRRQKMIRSTSTFSQRVPLRFR